MKKTYVDVNVYNTPRVSLPGQLPGSLSSSTQLIETFLSELCLNSADTLDLIQVCNSCLVSVFLSILVDSELLHPEIDFLRSSLEFHQIANNSADCEMFGRYKLHGCSGWRHSIVCRV